MAAVLVATGALVYTQLRADLDDRVDTELAARAQAAGRVAGGLGGSQDATPALRGLAAVEEGFAQILTPAGRVVASSGGPGRRAALSAPELARASRGRFGTERVVGGIEGPSRLLAEPARSPSGDLVVVVGQSLDDRDEALASLVRSLALGGPLAIALASAIGYLLATAGFRPVEAMRSQARAIALGDEVGRLPLPASRDEVRRLGETLNEMLDRLRRSLAGERAFVADASHELRTPIAVVKAELEGVLRTRDLAPEVREALVAAAEECDSLAQLAEDLLVLARAGEGELPVRREAVAIRPLLEGVRERFGDRAAEHGRRIRVDARDDLTACADPLRLRQALGNLVDNALRHGAGAITLSGRSASPEVELTVADEGPGFPADVAPRAFQRFARGDRARGGAGAGLGLAIVQAIAGAHGGRAEIASGPGASVRLWLPGVPAGAGPDRS